MPPVIPGLRVLIFDNFVPFATIYGSEAYDPNDNSTIFCMAFNSHYGMYEQPEHMTRRRYREHGIGINRQIDRSTITEFQSHMMTQAYVAEPHQSSIEGKGVLVYDPTQILIPQSLIDTYTIGDLSHQEAHDQGFLV